MNIYGVKGMFVILEDLKIKYFKMLDGYGSGFPEFFT